MKVVLTIGGSDSSGGAGIQADLKTFEAFGLFGASAVTVLTAQNTTGVEAIRAVDAEFLRSQIDAVLSDLPVAAIKIGMLYNRELIETLDAFLDSLDLPVILDPVCVSKAGSPLLADDALDALRRLSRRVSLTTPNLHEARLLYGYEYAESDTLRGVMEHPTPIVVKNHPLGEQCADLLYHGRSKRVFVGERLETRDLHGTGCSYASAIAASLALEYPMDAAIERAKRFVTEAIRRAPRLGRGPGPINHKAGGEHVA